MENTYLITTMGYVCSLPRAGNVYGQYTETAGNYGTTMVAVSSILLCRLGYHGSPKFGILHSSGDWTLELDSEAIGGLKYDEQAC